MWRFVLKKKNVCKQNKHVKKKEKVCIKYNKACEKENILHIIYGFIFWDIFSCRIVIVLYLYIHKEICKVFFIDKNQSMLFFRNLVCDYYKNYYICSNDIYRLTTIFFLICCIKFAFFFFDVVSYFFFFFIILIASFMTNLFVILRFFSFF
jgi:hypothetical protein